MKRQTIFLFAGLAAFAVTPAEALVTIVGAGRAHDCFVAAKTGIDPHEGIMFCDIALAEEDLDTRDRAGTLVNRGVLEVALGEMSLAMRDYDHGIELKPDLGDAYVDRGAAFITLKQYEEAMTNINKGIALGMSYPHIGYFNRAVAEELLGQYKDSYYDFKHVLELEPDFTQASDQLKNFTVTTVRTP